MLKSVIKYINISYFFLICININGNIMLDENDKLTTPLPLPYNGEIYSVEFLDKFIDKSIKDGKQPILIFGANWCPDCIILHQITLIPQMAKFINENFELIYVDVGDYRDGSEPKNKQILLNYGIAELEGVPTIVVLSKDLKVLNKDSSTQWRNARERQPSEFYFYLNSFLS